MRKPSKSMLRPVFLSCALTLAIAGPARTCWAQAAAAHKTDHERLDDMITCVVNDVRDWLSQQSVKEITIGNIQSPPNCASTGVVQALADEMKLQKLTYKRNAKHQLWGQFVKQSAAKAESSQVVKFEFSLRDRDQDSKVVKRLAEHRVTGRADVEKLLPPPVSALSPSQSTTTTRSPGFGQMPITVNSPYRIEGSTVFPAKDNRFGVEVLLKVAHDQYTPLTPTMEDGVVYLNIPVDAVYAVKLINRSDADAAVDLAIDGINLFQFCKERNSDGKPVFTHYIAQRLFETLLKGWYRDAQGAYEFLTSNAAFLPEEMRGLASNEKTGVITAQFCIAKSAASAAGKDEVDSLRKRTIVGKATQQTSQVESWTWDAAAPAATIAIRYDKK